MKEVREYLVEAIENSNKSYVRAVQKIEQTKLPDSIKNRLTESRKDIHRQIQGMLYIIAASLEE